MPRSTVKLRRYPSTPSRVSDYTRRVGARLREYRLRRFPTVKHATIAVNALLAGSEENLRLISDQTWYSYEVGRVPIALAYLPAIARAMGVSPRSLLPPGEGEEQVA